MTHEPRVKVIKFGDGYEQRFKDGINNQLKRYQLNFVEKMETGKAIDEFLRARGAVESFTWQGMRYEPYPVDGPPVADEKDQPTTDPLKDRCSKKPTGCIKRYPRPQPMPFGGFLGANKLG